MDEEAGAISGSRINEEHLDKYTQKNMEKVMLEWAFNLLKKHKIIPEDTILEIKEKEQ